MATEPNRASDAAPQPRQHGQIRTRSRTPLISTASSIPQLASTRTIESRSYTVQPTLTPCDAQPVVRETPFCVPSGFHAKPYPSAGVYPNHRIEKLRNAAQIVTPLHPTVAQIVTRSRTHAHNPTTVTSQWRQSGHGTRLTNPPGANPNPHLAHCRPDRNQITYTRRHPPSRTIISTQLAHRKPSSRPFSPASHHDAHDIEASTPHKPLQHKPLHGFSPQEGLDFIQNWSDRA